MNVQDVPEERFIPGWPKTKLSSLHKRNEVALAELYSRRERDNTGEVPCSSFARLPPVSSWDRPTASTIATQPQHPELQHQTKRTTHDKFTSQICVSIYIYMSTQPNVSITLVLHDVYYISAWLSQVPKKKASSSLCHHIVGAHNFDGHHRAIHLACTHMAQV